MNHKEMTPEEELNRFIEKFKNNVLYQRYSNPYFVTYDVDVTKKITKKGRKLLKKMSKMDKFIEKNIRKNFGN